MKEWRIEAGWNISIPMDYKDYLDLHVGDVIHFEIFDNQQGKRGLLIIKEQSQSSKAPPSEPTGQGSEAKSGEVDVPHGDGGVEKCPKCQSRRLLLAHCLNVGYCYDCKTEFDIEDAGVTLNKEAIK